MAYWETRNFPSTNGGIPEGIAAIGSAIAAHRFARKNLRRATRLNKKMQYASLQRNDEGRTKP
jgi:hypothetical protein